MVHLDHLDRTPNHVHDYDVGHYEFILIRGIVAKASGLCVLDDHECTLETWTRHLIPY